MSEELVNKLGTAVAAHAHEFVDGLADPILLKREEIRRETAALEHLEDRMIDALGGLKSMYRRHQSALDAIEVYKGDILQIAHDGDETNDAVLIPMGRKLVEMEDAAERQQKEIQQAEADGDTIQAEIDAKTVLITSLQQELTELEQERQTAINAGPDSSGNLPPTTGEALKIQEAVLTSRAKARIDELLQRNTTTTSTEDMEESH